jgi:hypothetical protein
MPPNERSPAGRRGPLNNSSCRTLAAAPVGPPSQQPHEDFENSYIQSLRYEAEKARVAGDCELASYFEAAASAAEEAEAAECFSRDAEHYAASLRYLADQPRANGDAELAREYEAQALSFEDIEREAGEDAAFAFAVWHPVAKMSFLKSAGYLPSDRPKCAPSARQP